MTISTTSLLLAAANTRMQAESSFADLSSTDSNYDATSLFMAAISGGLDVGGTTDSGAWPTPGNDSGGLAANGLNMALADPASAYNMMTLINNEDVLYKAQFAELSSMKDAVSQMQQAAQSLDISGSSSENDINAQLQGFVDQYNNWIQKFSSDMKQGGLLADTQAAQMARRELDQSIENTFNGVKDGVHGLGEIGITIDPSTGLATLDHGKLDAMVTGNKQGVVDAVNEFAANFAEAAKLLNSNGNFMPSQLDNLNRAIHYIDSNHASLQAEFGTGDAAKPTGAVAQALAAYNQIYGS